MTNKKNKKEGIYVEYGRELFKSKAYISLTGKSTQVYGILLSRRQLENINRGKSGKRPFWVIKNNGKIVFKYEEAELLGISKTQFRHAIDQLVNRGFIRIIPGYPLNFELIDNWKNYGTEKFEPVRRDKMSTLFEKPKTIEEKMKFYKRFKRDKNKSKNINSIDKNTNKHIDKNINKKYPKITI